MSQQGAAKAGHGSSAGSDAGFGAARDGLAAGPAHARAAGTGHPDNWTGAAAFGEGQSEAEAQLYAYMGMMANPAPLSGFPPLDELNARLNEQAYRDSLLFPRSEGELNDGLFGEPPAPEPALSGDELNKNLGWFEQRFAELKRLIVKHGEGKREILQINERIREIFTRLDQISSDMPDGQALASVDTKLSALSKSLDAARERNAADSERIARAAKEIMAASARLQEAPAKFESVARHTVEGLGQTVNATAARAAVMAADRVSVNVKQPEDGGWAERLEAELRTLNRQSRENGQRTEAALDRVNGTLKDFLVRSPAARDGAGASAAPQPKKRSGLHEPISSNSAVYMRGEAGFGATPAHEPRLDTLLRRDPPPSDPNLFEALRDASRKYAPQHAAGQPRPDRPAAPARPAFTGAQALEEDKGTPLGGIAIVAFVLLLAAAALFYLQTKGHLNALRISSAQPAAERQVRTPAATSSLHIPQYGPVLLASQEGGRAAPVPAVQEELEALEASARKGDRDAQFRIGLRFLTDSAFDGGPAAAARWFAKAAAQGHTEAQFVLASMYERGAGVVRDEPRAIALYRLAASAGHVRSMHNLGAMLLKNANTASYREAAAWFEQAASRGFPDSEYNLALLYEHGLGVEQDLLRAYEWYVKAAGSGVKEALMQAERLRHLLPAAGAAPAVRKPAVWRTEIVTTTIAPRKRVHLKG